MDGPIDRQSSLYSRVHATNNSQWLNKQRYNYFLPIAEVTTMDVGDGALGTSADVPGRRSWTGVGFILLYKNIEKEAIVLKTWKKITYFWYYHWLFGQILTYYFFKNTACFAYYCVIHDEKTVGFWCRSQVAVLKLALMSLPKKLPYVHGNHLDRKIYFKINWKEVDNAIQWKQCVE